MSHTNYNGMSNKTKPATTNVSPVTPPEPDETLAPATVVETLTSPEPIIGTVFDCNKLNVRKNPNTTSAILFTITKDTKVEINLEESTTEWYKVIVNGQEGFCMKKYITLPQ